MEHLSPMTLDALDLGCLDALSAEAARQHLGGCERCAAEAADLRASRRQFEASIFARTLPALERRRTARRRWPWLLVPALAAVPLLAVFALPRPEPEVIAKGGPFCEVFARRGTRVFAVTDGSALAPGDEIRFVVHPAGRRHVLVASLDAASAATIYAPFGASQSLELDPRADRAELPGSVRLDGTPGPERIYCLFSGDKIESKPVLSWLREVGAGGGAAVRNPPLPALPGVVAVSALVEKVVP
jgi:hypothetical protein